MADLRRQLDGYRLTTAEILYHMPDAPALLQSFIWQEYDIAPDYPRLRRFLDFWHEKLDGPLHSVRIGQVPLVTPSAYRHLGSDCLIH
ncbi:MAG TPA: Usg family protein [Alphaproteobacteria bacterium]|jgi:uncharacterized protein Usg|nr:Usg family protein [Alphaproteobacteria bacterium]